MVDGPGGEAFAEGTHEEFVDAGHQGDGSEVGWVRGVLLLVDEYGACVFPSLWHVGFG